MFSIPATHPVGATFPEALFFGSTLLRQPSSPATLFRRPIYWSCLTPVTSTQRVVNFDNTSSSRVSLQSSPRRVVNSDDPSSDRVSLRSHQLHRGTPRKPLTMAEFSFAANIQQPQIYPSDRIKYMCNKLGAFYLNGSSLRGSVKD